VLATFGIVLSLGGASAATLALRRLGRQSCPACGTVGGFVPIRETIDDLPSGRPGATRILRCRDCGAALEERVAPTAPRRPAAVPAR